MTVTGPEWWAVVLSWNGREETLRCLASLGALTGPPVGVVCVDNGSRDGTPEAVRSLFASVDLVENGCNLGYAGGCNVGIRHALRRGARWVVLVNNDARVEPRTFAALGEAARAHPDAGVLAGKVFFDDGSDRLWYAGAGVRLALGYHGRVYGYGRRDGPDFSHPKATGRATGALMAVSRTAIERAGLLEEALFAYVEDLEWSVRIRQAGLEVRFVPDARAWHRVSASTGGERASTHNLYYGVRNTLAVSERHRPLPPIATSLRRVVVLVTFAAQALGRPQRRAALGAVLEGWRDARRGRLGERAQGQPRLRR